MKDLFSRFFPVVTIAFVAGCASSGVVPIGGDSFMISKSNPTILGGSEIKADLFREANEHCGKTGQTIKVLSESSRNAVPFVRGPSAELRFRCEERK